MRNERSLKRMCIFNGNPESPLAFIQRTERRRRHYGKSGSSTFSARTSLTAVGTPSLIVNSAFPSQV